MSVQTIITLRQVCESYHIELETIRDFADFGFYPIVLVGEEYGVETIYLDRLERVISLYQSLGINKEGIDIILELRGEITRLQQMIEEMQNETKKIKEYMCVDDPEALRNLGRLIEIDD